MTFRYSRSGTVLGFEGQRLGHRVNKSIFTLMSGALLKNE